MTIESIANQSLHLTPLRSAGEFHVRCFGEGLLTFQSKDKYQCCLVNSPLKQVIE